MKHKLSFEGLDLILGNHAPFLISLSDGLEEELRMILAASEAGDTGGNIPNLEGVDEAEKQVLDGILTNTRPIEIDDWLEYHWEWSLDSSGIVTTWDVVGDWYGSESWLQIICPKILLIRQLREWRIILQRKTDKPITSQDLRISV